MRKIDGKWIELTEGIKARKVWSWQNGDWSYYDANNWDHLMRQINGKWVELTEGIKAKDAWLYGNGDWGYNDEEGRRHRVKFDLSKYKTEQKDIPSGNLITKEEAIAKYGKNKVCSFENGDWSYYDADGWAHLMRKINGKWVELTKGIKAKWIWFYKNGDWEYEDEEGKCHVGKK
jgi:hypothetical protein